MNEHSFFNKNNWNSWVKLTYYSTNNWRNYKFDYTHSHDRLEILYVYYGELTLVYSDDKNWKEVTVHSNGYILIDADVPHTLRTGDVDSLVFALELKLIPESVSSLKYSLRHLISCDPYIGALFSQAPEVIQLSDSGHVAPLIRELQRCLDEPGFEHDNFLDLLVSAVFPLSAKIFIPSNMPCLAASNTCAKQSNMSDSIIITSFPAPRSPNMRASPSIT